MKFERMLCAIDFSETSAAAVRTAGCLAKVLQTDLTVLHAQRWELPLYFTAAQTQELELQLNKGDRAAQKYFEDFVTRNLPAEFPRHYRFVEGEAVSAILRTAAEIKADVIVVGTHGRTGWNRFRLGSVMEGVLRQTAVPLFAVGPKAATADCAAPVREIFCPSILTLSRRRRLRWRLYWRERRKRVLRCSTSSKKSPNPRMRGMLSRNVCANGHASTGPGSARCAMSSGGEIRCRRSLTKHVTSVLTCW